MYRILLITLLFFSPVYSSTLHELLPPNPFVLSASQVEEILLCTGMDMEELLQNLIPIAKTFARPPISDYQVGIAALGKSGKIYLGVNLEFPGNPLYFCIHGEQFLITNARSHGETELVAIALSAAPCGHCRQFLNEIGDAEGLVILTPNKAPTTLAKLLPEPFGPQDLGLTGNLLTMADRCRINPHGSKLMARAIDAAEASYAPYSQSKSGVAIETLDGKIYLGSNLENAAFNPSISPLQAALITLVADLKDYSDIRKVAFYEYANAKISQENVTRDLLKQIAPQAILTVEKNKL